MRLNRITEGELSVLQILWERGDATNREIAAAMYGGVTHPKMASVQKMVERLEAKGCVKRDRRDRAHRLHPLVSREQLLQSRVQALADRLCDGELVPLIEALLKRGERFPEKERQRVRELIGDHRPPKKRGRRRPD
jgi:predicted transcriptional regulator